MSTDNRIPVTHLYDNQSEYLFTMHMFWSYLFFTLKITVYIYLYYHPNNLPHSPYKSLLKLRHFSHHGTSLSISCWLKPMSCVISHNDTTVPNSQSSSNSWPLAFSFNTVDRLCWLGEEFLWCIHNQCRFYSYQIICHMNLFSDWLMEKFSATVFQLLKRVGNIAKGTKN